MPISLHHAQVFYQPGGEAKARDFYTKGLGLPEIERPSALAERDGLWFEAGQGQVHLSAQEDLALHGRRKPPEYVFDPFGNKIELDEIPAKR